MKNMNSEPETAGQEYRDKISTVDQEGKRVWIYPHKPSGPLTSARAWISVLLLGFLFIAPFIRVNGQPLILLDVLNRKFILFGIVFWPQDFHIFVLATISLIVFILLFTVVFGRVWCGWACPQTVFMEMVFRRIEYWIEGDARQQKALNRAPWTASKSARKITKHAVFFSLSFLIGNTFLAYIIGTDSLLEIVTAPPAEHLAGLTAMLLFSGAFYWVFAFFREQVCTLVCPYGRLQGVLLDRNSIVVAYDFRRGEPRGRFSRKQPRDRLGDCVDCSRCVQVCPTGIDIRNGTQLECINCTACIDACNRVMQKVHLPKGLIRYASHKGISEGKQSLVTGRVAGYGLVFILLSGLTFGLIAARDPIETTVLRTPGTMYQQNDAGMISNLYNLKIVNKTFEPRAITLRLESPEGDVRMVGGDPVVPENDVFQSAFFVEIPYDRLQFVNTPVRIGVYSQDELIETITTSFIGPDKFKK